MYFTPSKIAYIPPSFKSKSFKISTHNFKTTKVHLQVERTWQEIFCIEMIFFSIFDTYFLHAWNVQATIQAQIHENGEENEMKIEIWVKMFCHIHQKNSLRSLRWIFCWILLNVNIGFGGFVDKILRKLVDKMKIIKIFNIVSFYNKIWKKISTFFNFFQEFWQNSS